MKSPARTSTSRKTPTPRAKATASTRPATRARRAKTPAADGLADLTPPVHPTEEAVRMRAYEIYLLRNGDGDPTEHWLQAERELLGRTA